MNISGVLVQTEPAALERVERALAGLPGVEVHGSAPAGRIVATVEEADAEVGRSLLAIQALPGVLCASLVYQQSDSDPDLQETCDVADTP